jgi:hypothetical protein
MNSQYDAEFYKEFTVSHVKPIIRLVPVHVRDDPQIKKMLEALESVAVIKNNLMDVETSSSSSQDIRVHPVNVKNQFQYSESTRVACISISILTLYHLYRGIESGDELLSSEEWNILLSRSVQIHNKWKEVYGQPLFRLFPTIDEILSLPMCKPFVDIFGSDTREYCGVAVQHGSMVNPEGDLTKLFKDMKDTTLKENRVVCALIILPGNCCISVICRSLPRNRYSLFVFDSHGGGGHNKGGGSKENCELLEIYDYEKAACYLISKYNIKALTQSITQKQGFHSQSEESILSQYGYSAKLFIK